IINMNQMIVKNQFTSAIEQLNLYRHLYLLIGHKQDETILDGILQHQPIGAGKAHQHHIEPIVDDVAASTKAVSSPTSRQVSPGLFPHRCVPWTSTTHGLRNEVM